MIFLFATIACIMIVVAAWLGLRRHTVAAVGALLLALVPLLFGFPISKAVFVWLGLVGPIVIAVVMLAGIRDAGPSDVNPRR